MHWREVGLHMGGDNMVGSNTISRGTSMVDNLIEMKVIGGEDTNMTKGLKSQR